MRSVLDAAITGLGNRRGTVAVEYALIASALMLLVLGGIGTGLLMWSRNALQVAAVETARCVVLGTCGSSGSTAFAQQVAQAWGFAGLANTMTVTVTANSPCFGKNGTTYTEVSITSQEWAKLLIAPLTGIQLNATACFPNTA